MSSSNNDAEMEALNSKLQGAFGPVVEDLKRINMRQMEHQSIKCLDQCFDKAGSTWDDSRLQECSNQCQFLPKQGTQIIQNEIEQFQSRLQRSMMDCQDKARDVMVGSTQSGMNKNDDDPSLLQAKADEIELKCVTAAVENQIELIKPFKERIESQLKQLQQHVASQVDGINVEEPNKKQRRGWW